MRDPEATALWLCGDSITYQQLEINLARVVNLISCCGDQKVIGLASGNAWLSFLFVQACSQINQPLLMLSPELPGPRLQQLLSQCGCNFVITDTTGLDTSSETTVIDEQMFYSLQPGEVIRDATGRNSTNIQLIVATSGSSGEPKGVMLSAAAIEASAVAVNASLGLQANDCWLNCLPLYHIAGLSIIYRCHFAAASMVLQQGFKAQQVWQDLHRYSISHVSLVPAMLSHLIDVSCDASPPGTLRVALIGGAALSPTLAERARQAGWPLVISYGMTETASLCAYDASADAGMVAGRVGHPLDGFDISVASNEGTILVSGAALMSGYANPDLSPGSGLIDNTFATGDSGRLDEDGILYVSGRSDEALLSAGRTIHPREVEQQLEQFTGIGRVAVTAITDPVWGDRLVAVYEAGSFDASCFESWAREQLPSVICPRIFMPIDRLPLNSMGKIDRSKLRQIIRQ